MWAGAFRSVLPPVLLIVVLVGIPARAAADPVTLASAAIEHGSFDLTGGRFIFAVSPVIHRQLFNEFFLTPADIGRTLIGDATTDADFPYFAQLLTNGVGNYNETQFATARGIGAIGRSSEGPLFGLTTPDFRGFRIDAITFTINQFQVEPYFGSEVLWLRGTLSVLGDTVDASVPAPTPEPGSLLLVVSGIAAVSARIRRRRH